MANLKTAIEEATAAGSVRLFSVRHEFPTEWAKFLAQPRVANQRFELALNIQPENYPFWSKGRLNGVKRVDILARSTRDPAPANLHIFDQVNDQPQPSKKDSLERVAALGNLLVGKLTAGASGIALPAKPVGTLKLFFDDNKDVSDLWLVISWNG